MPGCEEPLLPPHKREREKEKRGDHQIPTTKIIHSAVRLPLTQRNQVVVKRQKQFQLTHGFPSHTHKHHIGNWDQLMCWLESSAI